MLRSVDKDFEDIDYVYLQWKLLFRHFLNFSLNYQKKICGYRNHNAFITQANIQSCGTSNKWKAHHKFNYRLQESFQDGNVLHNSRFFGMKMFHCKVWFSRVSINNIINKIPWSANILPHLWQLHSFAFFSYQVFVFAFSPNNRVKASDNNYSSNQTESHKLIVVTLGKFDKHCNNLLRMLKLLTFRGEVALLVL